jgi:energy-coupling factor transporter ATP-binding protein EcfA2
MRSIDREHLDPEVRKDLAVTAAVSTMTDPHLAARPRRRADPPSPEAPNAELLHRATTRLVALRRVDADGAASTARRTWAAIPHRNGASVTVEYQWHPERGVSVRLGASRSASVASGLTDGLRSTHEAGADDGTEPSVPFVAAQVARLQRCRLDLQPGVAGPPMLVAGFSPGFDDGRTLVEALQRQPDPVCIRIVATATTLTADEEDAILSSLPDPDATDLTRLIRRAEGAPTRAGGLFRLLPSFEVGIFVAAPVEVPPGVIAALAATLSPPSDNGLHAPPMVDIHDAAVPAVRGYHELEMPPSPDDPTRLQRVFGTGDLHTVMRLPYATTPTYPGFEVRRSRILDRAERPARSTGLLIGTARSGARTDEVRIGDADLARHLLVTGQTGTGKSRLLEHLACQEAERGGGFAFIDPHGDSVDRLIARLPKSRRGEIEVVDPSTEVGRVAINPLEADGPVGQAFVIQDLGEMFYDLFDPGRSGIVGPRFEAWLRTAALTLLDAADHGGPPASLIDIPRLFTDDEFLKERFRFVRSQYVIDFWIKEMGKTSDYHRSEMLGWFASKFERFASNPIMRSMLGPGRNDIDISQLMDDGGILLVRLPKGLIGDVNASLLGYILSSRMWVAAMARASRPEADRRPFTLFIDEFQNFTSVGSIDTMLSESRKFKLRLCLANQFSSQLRPAVLAAVDGNVGNRITFRVGVPDAKVLEPLYAGAFEAEDLVNLPNLTAAAVLLDDGEPQPPFTLTTGRGPSGG